MSRWIRRARSRGVLRRVLESHSPGCNAATAASAELLARVKAAGAIRRDVELDDVICMATAVSLAVQDTPSDTKRIRRLVGMFVDGLRAATPARPSRSTGQRPRARTKAAARAPQ